MFFAVVTLFVLSVFACNNPFLQIKDNETNNNNSKLYTIEIVMIDNEEGDNITLDTTQGYNGDIITLNYTVADTADKNMLHFEGIINPIIPTDKAGSGAREYEINAQDAFNNIIIIIANFFHSDLIYDQIEFYNTSAHIFKTFGDAPFTNAITGEHNGTGLISYSSSDEEIAVVDAAGEVNILKAGIAIITASKAADEIFAHTTKSYTLTIDMYTPPAPNAPKLGSKSGATIILKEPADADSRFTLEYAYNTSNTAPEDGWQEGLEFKNLASNKMYYFFTRYKAVEGRYNASPASIVLVLKINEYFQFDIMVKAGDTFSIPLRGQLNNVWNKPYNWNIDWGDGAVQIIASTDTSAPQNSNSSAGIPHVYVNGGTYTIKITPNGSLDAWFAAYGNRTDSINDMIIKVNSPLTPLMTRTQVQLDTGLAPSYEWAYTFYYCINLTMGVDFNFSEEWNNIITAGDFFAMNMFEFCNGNAFTMNEIFNLPQNITTVGDHFVGGIFTGCNGTSFTMNKIFNLPQNITTIGDFFASGISQAYGYSGMFHDCSGAAFTMNEIFNLPQGITTIGDGFAFSLFSECAGNAFTMNEIFNLPQGITTIGDDFAFSIFRGCAGNAFTMNEIFNLPQGITTAGVAFAALMFRGCVGNAFTMNEIFNLPQEITTAGDAFAASMFSGCAGNAFTMNEIFNLPQGITTAGDAFATNMFTNCSGNAFMINPVFKFPLLTQSQINLSTMFSDTFRYLRSSAPFQTRTAASIINGNLTPNTRRYTFSGGFTDINSIEENWK